MEQQALLEGASPPVEVVAEPSLEATDAVALSDEAQRAEDMPPAVEPAPEQQVYRHDHGGGRQFEGTLDEARKLCPVLGRMSLQEAGRTLARADLAERMAAKGREKRLAEAAAKKAEPIVAEAAKPAPEKVTKQDTPEPVVVKTADAPTKIEEPIVTPAAEVPRPQPVPADRLPAQPQEPIPREVRTPVAPEPDVQDAQRVSVQLDQRPQPMVDVVAERIQLDTRQSHEIETAVRVAEATEIPVEPLEPVQSPVMTVEANVTTVMDPVDAVRAYELATAVPPDLELAEPATNETSELIAGTAADVEPLVLPIQTSHELPSAMRPVAELDLDTAPAETVCDDFAEALQALITPATILPAPSVKRAVSTTPQIPEMVAEDNPVPAIAAVVSHQLPELAPAAQAVAAPILVEIAQVLQAVRQPESRTEHMPSSPEADKTHLETLVTELFEALAIEYSEEDVRQLVLVLLRSSFQLPQSAIIATADLEREGTHEAKRRLRQFAASLADVENHIQQLLGGFALFQCYSPGLRALLLAV